MEVQDIQMQIQSYLCQLGFKDLEGIAKTLGCSEGETKDKNRRKLVSLIKEQLKEALKTKADKIEYLEEFKSQLMEDTPVCPPLDTTPGNAQSPSKEGKPCVEDKSKVKEKSKVEEKPKVEDLKPKVEDVKPLYFQPRDFKREFKIIGQIGEPGQKDKLSFVSLARQIEGALQKGYKPPEVVDAVVRAINPGMRLRSYIEGLEGLTLPPLRSILRSHYQEKSTTELYRQLSTLAKEPRRVHKGFLSELLIPGRKFCSPQRRQTQLKYDPALVQGMFLHALDTGLQDAAVRKLCGFKGHSAHRGCSKCFKYFPGSFNEKTDYSGFDKDSWPPRHNSSHHVHAEMVRKALTQRKHVALATKYGVYYSCLLQLEYFGCSEVYCYQSNV